MASDRIEASPPRAARPAVTIAPIHATSVPSIHQIGRYHHVLPPPTASQVHGNARKGRSRMMSIAIKTIVPHSPIAAALARRTLDEYVLPLGWMAIAAGNRAEDRVWLIAPLLNRFVHLELHNDDWQRWALRSKEI